MSNRRSLRRDGKVRPATPAEAPAARLTSRRMRRLARQVRALSLASHHVDYDDPQAEATYYAVAASILESVIATPATTLGGLRVKAEAIAWCHGGQLSADRADSTADRLVASMVHDLLRSRPAA